MIRKATIVGVVLSMFACAIAASHGGQFLSTITAAAAATAGPNPGPAPAPSGICDNCDGRGKIGDGTVMVTCPVCNGTGKRTAQARPEPWPPTTLSPPLSVKSLDAATLSPDAQPTPPDAIAAGIAALNLQSGDAFAEIGTGYNAPWLQEALKVNGVRGVGLEIDPALAESARGYVSANIVTGDATKFNIKANKAAAFLWEDTLAALRPQLAKFDAFVSYAHEVPGGVPGMTVRQVGDCFVYERAKFKTVVSYPSYGVWNGVKARPKPGCNCRMCISLHQQLKTPIVRQVPVSTSQPAAVQQQQQARGRWVTQKVCVNGRCRMVRSWQAY